MKVLTAVHTFNARSSISKTPLRMSNSIGLIDGGYRGELKVYVDNISDDPFELKKGNRFSSWWQ